MYKPRAKTDKDKADTASEQTSKEACSDVQKIVPPSSPAAKKTAIQRQLDRELTASEPVVAINSATAVQEPIPPAGNTLLRKARFAAITLLFSGLTFWLGLQFSSQPDPAVATAAVEQPAIEPAAVNLDQQNLSGGGVAISQPLGEQTSTSIEDDIPVAAIDSAKNERAPLVETAAQESVTDAAMTTSAIAAGIALTAKNSPVEATATQQPSIETTQATTTAARTNPEPDATASTTVEDSSRDTIAAAAATAVVAATVVAATQSKPSTRTATLTDTSVAKAAEAVPSADQAITLEDEVQAPEQKTVTEENSDGKFAQFIIEYRKQSNQLIQRKVIYPRRAIARNQQGKVSIEVFVDRNGKVLDMVVLEDPGHKLLVKAAIRAIKKVKNLPVLPTDFPNDTFSVTIPIVFKMP